MLLPRELFSSPPPARTSKQNNPTLLVSWWCTGFALAVILVRIVGRYIRTERLFREDKIMALSMIPLCARMALVHLVLIWGTNNAVLDPNISDVEKKHREIGSKLVLASRIMYALFLWTAKFTVAEFLKRLTSVGWKRSYEIGLHCIRWFLGLTFIAVVIATLSECQPFDQYWQVVPEAPAHCRQGVSQLITMGTTDVITDLVLVCFPIPIVLKANMLTKRKISLILLFGLSLILVGITIYRVIGTLDRHANQQFRSLLASLEILAAAAVANAIVLGSFIRDRGVKKQRFRYERSASRTSGQEPGTLTPKRTITARDWGSDADLVGGLGMRCAPELTSERPAVPRPAPVAMPSSEQANTITPAPVVGTDWSRKTRESADSVDRIDLEKAPESVSASEPVQNEMPVSSRGMSFFDVGGLLGASESDSRPTNMRLRTHSVNNPDVISQDHEQTSRIRTTRSHSLAVPYPSALSASSQPPHLHPISPSPPLSRPVSNGSQAFLQDLGGLLSSPNNQAPSRSSHDVMSTATTATNNNISNDLEDDEDNADNDTTLYSPASSTSAPPSAPEVHRDMSLVDVLRETPPQSIQAGAPSSRQQALQRMRRGERHGNIGGSGGEDGESEDGAVFRDVGGLLS